MTTKNKDLAESIERFCASVTEIHMHIAGFGIDKARQHIRSKGVALLVEGYLDVIALHQAGITNTVATCGTAITPDQMMTNIQR